MGAHRPGTWARVLYGLERGRALQRPAGLHHFVDRRTLAGLGRQVLDGCADDTDCARQMVRAVLDTYYERSRNGSQDTLVEKTPLHVLHLRDILEDFAEAHAVEVVRDGRDVCVSMQMRAARMPEVPKDRRAQAEMWTRSVRAGLEIRTDPAFSDRVTLVRYEDLKAHPEREVARIFSELRLPASRRLVEETVAATDISRYRLAPGEFRFRGEAGAWKEHFTSDDEQTFQEIAGSAFEEAGYRY